MPLIDRTFSDIITFTRASTARYFNSSGVLTSAAVNEARFDYDPATLLAHGFLIEEQRTNSIRNNTMQGAVAGTPGTPPTNWAALSTITGITAEIVGTGTSNGITYIDIKLAGTSSAASAYHLVFDANTAIAASTGQTWTSSSYLALVAGSFANIATASLRCTERASGGSFVGTTEVTISEITSNLSNNRIVVSRTLGATAAFVQGGIIVNVASGVAIDITLRIGLPQLEQGAFATSVIPTTTTALTRSADVASVNTLSPWFNVVEGSFVTEWVVSALGVDNNIASLSDGTTNNRHQNYVANTNAVLVRTAASGVASNNPNGTAVANAIGKFAFGYGSGTTAASFNGSAVTTTTQALPSSISTLYLGQSPAGGGQKQIWLRRYTFYPRKLSNAELQAITA